MSGKKEVMEHDPLADMADDENEGKVTRDVLDATSPVAATEPGATDEGLVDLEQSLTIAEVSEWHEKIMGLCDTEDQLSLKGGDLEIVDGAGLQLLAATMKEAAERHIVVTWFSVSDQLKRAAESVGLAAALGLDVAVNK